nr:MAG TPA: hypothetical protein [Caudoviricetes sp.]
MKRICFIYINMWKSLKNRTFTCFLPLKYR